MPSSIIQASRHASQSLDGMFLRTAGDGTGANGGKSTILAGGCRSRTSVPNRPKSEKMKRRSVHRRQNTRSKHQPHLRMTALGPRKALTQQDSPSRTSVRITERQEFRTEKKRFASRSTHNQPGHHHLTEPCSSGLDWHSTALNTNTQDVFPEAREGFRRGPCTSIPQLFEVADSGPLPHCVHGLTVAVAVKN